MATQVPIAAEVVQKPSYFLSFSTGEPHVDLFAECLDIVFKNDFELKRTPFILRGGASQLQSILENIAGCAFGVVCLDGLRPNVVFEYGVLMGAKIPVLLFKEKDAKVDAKHLYNNVPNLNLPAHPLIDLDHQFSDIKDQNYVEWNRSRIRDTVKIIWDTYTGRRADIRAFVEIAEPKL